MAVKAKSFCGTDPRSHQLKKEKKEENEAKKLKQVLLREEGEGGLDYKTGFAEDLEMQIYAR